MKQLIILVCYVKVSEGSTPKKIQEYVLQIQQTLNKILNEEIQEQTNTKISVIVIPVIDQATRIECIFPKILDEEVIKKIDEIKNSINFYL